MEERAEPSAPFVGFVKGIVIGYVMMTICLSLTLFIMLVLGQDVVCLRALMGGKNMSLVGNYVIMRL